jgi:hypothetical protein
VITGLLAGAYPAFYLSGFRPALILKGKLQPSAGGGWARKGLVVFQFALSVIFLVAVVVVLPADPLRADGSAGLRPKTMFFILNWKAR